MLLTLKALGLESRPTVNSNLPIALIRGDFVEIDKDMGDLSVRTNLLTSDAGWKSCSVSICKLCVILAKHVQA
jgi:hypothetical protein